MKAWWSKDVEKRALQKCTLPISVLLGHARLTDVTGPAVVNHVNGDAVVVNTRRHRVDTGEAGPPAAGVVIAALGSVTRALATVSAVVVALWFVVPLVTVSIA